MIWCKKQNKHVTLDEFVMLIMAEIEDLRKEIKMDFTNFDAALAKLSTDVSAEIAAAVAAITAAQNNPADVQHLADAVTSLTNADNLINAATAQFTGTATGTGTVPPPPTV
jgi:hypothetical protein